MQHTRTNDLPPPGATVPPALEFGHLLGTWHNTNEASRDMDRLVLSERDGALVVRVYGALEPEPSDWGEVVARPCSAGVTVAEVSGFEAEYVFGFMRTYIAAVHNRGVMVIHAYNRFTDDSGRPPYFSKEFFHR